MAAYTKLYLHLVWSTLGRAPLLIEEVERTVYRVILAKSKELDCGVMALGGYYDHVHVLLKFPTKHSIALMVRALKGASSYVMGEHLRWQGGYGAFTLRESEVAVVQNYIQRQKEHHSRNDLVHEWETSEVSLGLHQTDA
jgi:putative transposase